MCGFLLREKINLFGARLWSEFRNVDMPQCFVIALSIIKAVPKCMFVLQREQKVCVCVGGGGSSKDGMIISTK